MFFLREREKEREINSKQLVGGACCRCCDVHFRFPARQVSGCAGGRRCMVAAGGVTVAVGFSGVEGVPYAMSV